MAPGDDKKPSYPTHERLGFSTTILAGPSYLKEGIEFYKANPLQFKNEILSGLTVAIAQVRARLPFVVV